MTASIEKNGDIPITANKIIDEDLLALLNEGASGVSFMVREFNFEDDDFFGNLQPDNLDDPLVASVQNISFVPRTFALTLLVDLESISFHTGNVV